MYKQMDNLLSKMPVYNVRLTYLHGPQSCYTVISFDLLTKYSFNQMLPGHLIWINLSQLSYSSFSLRTLDLWPLDPPPQPGGTQTLTEFDVKWRHWHDEVDRSLQDNSFASDPNLELICKVCDLYCECIPGFHILLPKPASVPQAYKVAAMASVSF